MANTTSNYNLNKPLENEKVNISVLNQNMDIIDTNLKSLSDEIDSVKSDIPSTDGLITTTSLNTTLSSYAKKTDLPDEYDDTELSNRVQTIENDYLKSSDVSNWAKAENKPTYTADEVGADKSGSASTALSDAKTYTDTKISDLINSAPTTLDTLGEIATAMDNNQSVVEALEEAIGSKADSADIPTKVSELTNDKGYLTSSDIDTSQNHTHSNKTVLDKLTQNYIDKIDGIAEGAEQNVQSDWNAVSGDSFIKNKPEFATVATSGSYNDLVDKPTIPSTITVDSAISSTSINPVQNKVLYTELSGKASTSHGNHVPTIETANNAKFLRNDNTWQIVTPANIGALSATGTAANASRLSNTSAIGSSTNPVYFNANGVPVKTTHTLGASVPSDAVFTDTVYTHPTTAGNKHIPSGGSSGQILEWSASGTAKWVTPNFSSSGGTTVYYQTTEPSVSDTAVWIG